MELPRILPQSSPCLVSRWVDFVFINAIILYRSTSFRNTSAIIGAKKEERRLHLLKKVLHRRGSITSRKFKVETERISMEVVALQREYYKMQTGIEEVRHVNDGELDDVVS